MRIFAAALSTETNTFAPWPTGARGFIEIAPDDDSGNPDAQIIQGLQKRAAEDGHAFVAGLIASAEPSGPTLQSVYEGYRDRILADFREHGPFDVALLILHGAMVSTACDDCEGDLISHLRRIGGPELAIGVELDPHCHLTEMMVANADAIILMKEYPHSDFIPRSEEIYDICVRRKAGLVTPVSAVFDCRMVGFYPTTAEPMSGLLGYIREEEKRPGILSISFVHGFPWGDSPEAGSKVLVIADGDRELARAAAERIGRVIYARREAFVPHMPDIATALDLYASAQGRVVLADTADNAGGGAPSDNVSLLRAMLGRSLRDAAFGCIWDPQAVAICTEAGVGATFELRLGGKGGAASGDPLDVEITVRAIAERHDQQGLGDSRAPMGASVWIETGGIDIVVNSIRTQTFSPDAFTGLGIDLSSKRLIAVKSTQHFRSHFASLADEIILVATPGTLQMDFAMLPYRKKRNLVYFPRTNDPLGYSTATPKGVEGS